MKFYGKRNRNRETGKFIYRKPNLISDNAAKTVLEVLQEMSQLKEEIEYIKEVLERPIL